MGKIISALKLSRPKYKEELSTKESNMYKAWRCVSQVTPGEGEEPMDYVVYIRAPHPTNANYGLIFAFNAWERKANGIPDTSVYPKLSGGKVEAERLTEEQWYEYCKLLRKNRYKARGLDDNPSIFVVYSPGMFCGEDHVVRPEFSSDHKKPADVNKESKARRVIKSSGSNK
ncbi:MAG: hypothetical protein RR382_02415 [Tannerellaceae bacterium]